VNTEKPLAVDLADTVIMSCPHCKTCSLGLSKSEYAQVQAGQQMMTFCSVCGQEVILNAENS
jgi:hypothetical protein